MTWNLVWNPIQMFTAISQLAPEQVDTVIRLACFHCCHQACLPSNCSRNLCLGPLKKKAEKSANTYNICLVASKDPDGTEESDDGFQEDECSSIRSTNVNVTDAEMLYTSTEWSQKGQHTQNTHATIPMPVQNTSPNLVFLHQMTMARSLSGLFQVVFPSQRY